MKISYIKLLPTKMISKDEINDRRIDYEDYLTELVNFSHFFMELSNGEKFAKIIKQDNGQADIQTDRYELDFKLLVNQGFVNNKLKSLPYTDYSHWLDGCIFTTEKPNASRQAEANGLFVEFFYTLTQLTKKKLEEVKQDKDSELYSTIKMFKKNKNLLFFIPIEIKCDSDNDVVGLVERFANVFSLRDSINRDTFVTLLRNEGGTLDEFYILKYVNGKFFIVDKVHKLFITSFNRLYTLTSFTEDIN